MHCRQNDDQKKAAAEAGQLPDFWRDSWRDAMLSSGVPEAQLERTRTSLLAELQARCRGFTLWNCLRSDAGKGANIEPLCCNAGALECQAPMLRQLVVSRAAARVCPMPCMRPSARMVQDALRCVQLASCDT